MTPGYFEKYVHIMLWSRSWCIHVYSANIVLATFIWYGHCYYFLSFLCIDDNKYIYANMCI